MLFHRSQEILNMQKKQSSLLHIAFVLHRTITASLRSAWYIRNVSLWLSKYMTCLLFQSIRYNVNLFGACVGDREFIIVFKALMINVFHFSCHITNFSNLILHKGRHPRLPKTCQFNGNYITLLVMFVFPGEHFSITAGLRSRNSYNFFDLWGD